MEGPSLDGLRTVRKPSFRLRCKKRAAAHPCAAALAHIPPLGGGNQKRKFVPTVKAVS
jgi:hypothetical protein